MSSRHAMSFLQHHIVDGFCRLMAIKLPGNAEIVDIFLGASAAIDLHRSVIQIYSPRGPSGDKKNAIRFV